MPTFSHTQVPPDSTGNKVREVVVDTDKHIQCSVVADPEDAAAVGKVTNAAPSAADYGVVTRTPEPASATVANVAQNAAATTLLASNAARRGFVIHNDSESWQATLYVKFGASASLTDHTRPILPGETWERRGGYTGVITGIWSAAGSGNARVTEES